MGGQGSQEVPGRKSLGIGSQTSVGFSLWNVVCNDSLKPDPDTLEIQNKPLSTRPVSGSETRRLWIQS